MFRYLIAVVLLIISGVGFFTFTGPMYTEISGLKEEVSAYDEALDNSKALENERDKLTAKYNGINPQNLDRIKKLLPDNVDNIRLILEIEKIAQPYNMALRDVKYNPVEKESETGASSDIQGGAVAPTNANYGSWDLEFSVSGTYSNFLNFTKDLETNLRIVDIASINFSGGSETKANPTQPEVYRFDYKIKTYWLKN